MSLTAQGTIVRLGILPQPFRVLRARGPRIRSELPHTRPRRAFSLALSRHCTTPNRARTELLCSPLRLCASALLRFLVDTTAQPEDATHHPTGLIGSRLGPPSLGLPPPDLALSQHEHKAIVPPPKHTDARVQTPEYSHLCSSFILTYHHSLSRCSLPHISSSPGVPDSPYST